MPGLMTALLNSNWICWVMRISFSVTTISVFFLGHPGLSPPKCRGYSGSSRRHPRRHRRRCPGRGSRRRPCIRRSLRARWGTGLCCRRSHRRRCHVGAAVLIEVAVLVFGLEDALVDGSRECRRRRCPVWTRPPRTHVKNIGPLGSSSTPPGRSVRPSPGGSRHSRTGPDRGRWSRTRAAIWPRRVRGARTSSRRSSPRPRPSS